MRRDGALLLDMLVAARKIGEFTRDVDRTAFLSSALIQSAVMREIQVIGEAARLVSEATKATTPQIPWSEIGGMRNRIVHAYFDVDLEILWDTVENDIPRLVAQLEALVPPEDEGGAS